MRTNHALPKMTAFLSISTRNLRAVFSRRRYRAIGLLAGLIYLVVYLLTIQNIVYLPDVDLSRTTLIPSAAFAKDWTTKTWKTITPFVWEPIGVIYPVNHLMIFISIPNLLLGVLLGALIGMNLALGVYGLLAGRRGVSSLRGLLGAVPSCLTGFACCVPTFVIALGSVAASLTVGIIAVRPIFIPVSVLALSLNLLWSARRLWHES